MKQFGKMGQGENKNMSSFEVVDWLWRFCCNLLSIYACYTRSLTRCCKI